MIDETAKICGWILLGAILVGASWGRIHRRRHPKNNWFAAFAFWVFKYYGYKDVRLMNGGRKKWLEEDKPVTKDIP